jgi:signal transduction histidine kinase
MFDFAKAYEQIGVEELVDVDVEKAANDAVEMFSGLTFKVVNECHGLTVYADSLLRQLIYNFIDNTKNYGQKTTTARIHYNKTASGEIQLVYEDDGVGIPLANKEQLFKQGFSTGGSTGFGLFLSKKMIEVYGWTITEEGEPSKGAKFVIKIPSSKFFLIGK